MIISLIMFSHSCGSQVSLDESYLSRVADAEGMVTKMDFVRLGQDMKLLDFGGAMGEKRKPQTPRKERRGEETEGGEKVSTRNMICA